MPVFRLCITLIALVVLTLTSHAQQRVTGAIAPNEPITWQQGPTTPCCSERPPNIVLIVADDLGWNDLTFGGGGIAKGTVPTPNIDSIAKDGVMFTRGYAASGTCAPSRAALMSGRYPTRFGFEFTPTPPGMMQMIARSAGDRTPPLITHFDERGKDELPYPLMGMPTEEISLAETLKESGYHTVHIGKWHLGRENGMAPNDQGFDESLLMASGKYLPDNDPNVVNSKQEFDPIDRFLWMGMQFASSFNGGNIFEPGGYITDYYTEEAVKVIEANKNHPFFLYLAHWAPHSPLQATKSDYDALSHIEDHRERVYAAMLRALDRGVGEVLDALKENGLEDNTLVIFTSDNGGAGYVGLPEINEPYRGWKMTYFEGGIHVPYFMKWPEKIKAGTHYDKPVHHFDIFATAAAAALTEPPLNRTMDGTDLLPFVSKDGKPLSDAPHEHLFWRGGHYQAVMSDGWKLHKADRPDKVWLFNMNDDPTEQNNIAQHHPERVATMLKLLDGHNATQIEPAWPALLEAPTPIDRTANQPQTPNEDYVYWPN